MFFIFELLEKEFEQFHNFFYVQTNNNIHKQEFQTFFFTLNSGSTKIEDKRFLYSDFLPFSQSIEFFFFEYLKNEQSAWNYY